MKCKCSGDGVIMKQIAIAEYIAEPCYCVIKKEEEIAEEWFQLLKQKGYKETLERKSVR